LGVIDDPSLANTKQLAGLVDRALDLPRDSLEAEVSGMQEALGRIEAARNELNAVDGALKLVLQLLETADTEPLMGDHLHCLLSPLQARLSQSLTGLDEVL
jgi:hypothetical protein